jgi:hypothetical protein
MPLTEGIRTGMEIWFARIACPCNSRHDIHHRDQTLRFPDNCMTKNPMQFALMKDLGLGERVFLKLISIVRCCDRKDSMMIEWVDVSTHDTWHTRNETVGTTRGRT